MSDSNRRVLTGVLAGVLAAGVLLSVAFGAYRAGQDHEVVTRVAGDGGGEVVRVIDGGRHWGYGPGPGFFLFPLVGIGLVVLLVSRGRRHGYGPYGPGGYGGYDGGACGPDSREARMDDWHRRAHGTTDQGASPASTPPTG